MELKVLFYSSLRFLLKIFLPLLNWQVITAVNDSFRTHVIRILALLYWRTVQLPGNAEAEEAVTLPTSWAGQSPDWTHYVAACLAPCKYIIQFPLGPREKERLNISHKRFQLSHKWISFCRKISKMLVAAVYSNTVRYTKLFLVSIPCKLPYTSAELILTIKWQGQHHSIPVNSVRQN